MMRPSAGGSSIEELREAWAWFNNDEALGKAVHCSERVLHL
jgi:hypothetical protein